MVWMTLYDFMSSSGCWVGCKNDKTQQNTIRCISTGLGSSVGRVSAPRSGGTGFDPGLRHTKIVYNGTSCSPLGTRIFGVGLGLVALVSV